MSLLELSEPGRQSFLTSATIPDLTDRIIQSDDQYCDAGGFGDVFRCRCTSDDGMLKEVAVKAFRFNFTVNEHEQDRGQRTIRRELGIWRRLGHRNVVPFLGIAYGFGRQGSASLVSMWMPHGTLHAFLKAHDDCLVVAHRLQLLLDIANGLQYLHSFPLVHGDLSSNNVLLDHNYNACLSDFGCASLVGDIPEGFNYLKMSTVRPGTLRWAAPEHFSLNEEDSKHTVKSDIYSFGNMTLLILSGKYPWSDVRSDAAVVLRLSQGHKPDRPLVRPIDDRHWALIEQCWSTIPERPLSRDVVSSLQQLLGAYSPPVSLRDLLDVVTLSISIPNCPGNNVDLDDCPTAVESPLERPRSSPEQGHEPLLNKQKDTTEKITAEGSGEDIQVHGLVASGIPTHLNEEQVQTLLQKFGELKSFHLVREDGNGPSRGVALFEYVDVSLTDVVIQGLDGTELGNSCIVVRREGTASLDADESRRPRAPLTERKVVGNTKSTKSTRADKDDAQKRSEYARAGSSSGYYCVHQSAPSTGLQHGLRAEYTVSQEKQTTGKHATHPAPNSPPPRSKWIRGTFLGAGTYGCVYLALDTSTGNMIAVKQVKKGNKDGQRLNFVRELKAEQKILSGLAHPYIISYLGFEETTTFLSILLEYVPGGTIASCLREHGIFNENVAKLFSGQMFDGLAYLHANHIIHRNIEANNILVDLSGTCKLSGFGNAQRADDDRASWTTMRGTALWTAPEMIRYGGKRYGYKVDIWSGGCVLLKMWTGGRPSDGDVFASMVRAARQGISPPLPLGMIPSDLAVDLRNRCFAIDPDARASATELIQHPYLTLAPDWVFTGFT